jgi:hypothetical protein
MDAYYDNFIRFLAIEESRWMEPDAPEPADEEDLSEEYSDYLDDRDQFLEI